ncbi:MAG: hypothetical protein WC614_05905 [bacterium]
MKMTCCKGMERLQTVPYGTNKTDWLSDKNACLTVGRSDLPLPQNILSQTCNKSEILRLRLRMTEGGQMSDLPQIKDIHIRQKESEIKNV